jgi:hypothetical protein
LRNQPAPEVLEHAADRQRVEQDQAPERNPVHVPDTGGRAVQIRASAVIERHLPHADRKRERHHGAEQRREPRRQPENRQQHEQEYDGYQRNQARDRQVAERIDNLRKH